MAEIPDFDFIGPEDVKFINDLEKLFERPRFESYRVSYITKVIERGDAVLIYLSSRGNMYQALKLSEQNNIALRHFLYYMDEVFAAPVDRTDRAHYIVESFRAADLSQQRLNDDGEPFYEAVALRAKIEEILLADDDEVAKQDVVDMYIRDIHEPVEQFIRTDDPDDNDL